MEMKELLDMIALVSSIMSILLTLFFISYLSFRRKIFNRNKEEKPHLSYQRELLENDVYRSVDALVKDNITFADTNHLLLDASNNNELKSKREVPNLSYFSDLGLTKEDFEVKDRYITCLMPFNNKYNSLYAAIKNCCNFNGYQCKRTDEEKIESNSNLRKYIVSQIIQAQVVIAVLDGRNPNVLYEIGIAHAIGKLAILLVKRDKSSDLPENLKGNRLLIYRSEDDLFNQLSNTLTSIEYA